MIYRDYMPLNIIVPQTQQKILFRRNIADIIDNATLEEMIYFVGPYGSGKTMAVLSWLKNKGKNAAWVTLSKKEDTPESFFAYLSAAILMFAGEHETANNILDNRDFNENPRLFLTETLKRVSPCFKDMTLVIDNFHYIRNGGLLREIKEYITNMIGCWRVIIISRSELPPVFNDFMLKKHLRLVNLNDLNFTTDEIAEYFSINNLSVDSNGIMQIRKDTDGWAAALNAILTVKHNGTVKYNETAKAYVIGHFESEIGDSLNEKTKDFLLKTSILDKLTPSICFAVTETEESNDILKYLYTNGIFLLKHDRDTYSYHHAFREFLKEKLNSSGIDVKSLYINAGWWLYEKDESIPALLCFYHAGYLHGINTAFKKVKPAYMGMDEYVETTYCLTSLDIMELKQYPEVAVRIALLHFLTNNITEAQRIYRIIREWFEPGVLEILPEEYVDFFWELGWLRYVDPDENILFNPEFDKWVNVKEYAPHLLANDRARASTLRLPSILRGVRDFSVDIEKALKFYKMNNSTQQSIRDDAGLLVMDIIYAEICYEKENFEQAEKTIKSIIPIIERDKYTELFFSCIVLLVKITRAIHNPKEVEGLTDSLRTQIYANGHHFLLPNFHAFELRNRLANGISGMTKEFEQKNKPYKDKPCYYLIYRHIAYIRALISENKYNEASIMLGNLELMLRQYKRNMDLIEVNILNSVCEYNLGHESDAYRYLKAALDRGRKGGFIRIFSDDAELLYPVLNLINMRETDGYIRKIIVSCKKTLTHLGIDNSINKKIDVSLTDAEKEILKLLPTAMTYEEIAAFRNVKKSTIRAQVHNIYQKLNVGKRNAAVVTGIRLGLVKNR